MLLLALALAAPSAAQLPDHGLAGNDALLPPASVALDDGLTGLYINPAALAMRPGEAGLLLLQGLRAGTDEEALKPAFERRFDGNWSAVVGGRIALGLDHVSLPAGYLYGPGPDERETRLARSNRFSLGFSQRFDLPALEAQVGLGGAYRFTRSDAYALDGLSTLDLGLILRWRHWLSLGLSARNVDRPGLRGLEPGESSELAPSYTVGLALRPRAERFTLSYDVTQIEVGDNWEYLASAGLDLNIAGRGRLRLDLRDDGRFRLGLFLAEGYGRGALALGNQHDGASSTRYGSLALELRNRRFAKPLIPRRRFLELRLDGPLTDAPGDVSPASPGTQGLIALVERARGERDLAGIVIRLEEPAAGLAQMDELRRALLEYRRITGRPVLVHGCSFDNASYHLATGADRILLDPAGVLDLAEPQAQRLGFNGALAQAGISTAGLQHGRYRPAADTRTDRAVRPEALEADSTFAESRLLTLARGMAESRRVTLLDAPALYRRGGLSPVSALQYGLVDSLLNGEAVGDWLDAEYGQRRLMTPGRLAGRRYSREAWGIDARLALIQVEGVLRSGRGGLGVLGQEAGVADVADALARARRDKQILGVLLRLNSPGGSARACELLRREIAATAALKPVVISMGEAAAGGAYLAAVAGTHLLASRPTLTGAIAVWGGPFNYQGFLPRLGAPAALGAGLLARPRDPYLPYGDDERNRLQRELDQRYADFIAEVAARRTISEPEVELIARGRSWSGADALQYGLVDEIGGLREALGALRRLTRIPPTREIALVTLPAVEQPGRLARWLGRDRPAPPPESPLPREGESIPAWLERLDPLPDEAVVTLEPTALPLLPAAVLP